MGYFTNLCDADMAVRSRRAETYIRAGEILGVRIEIKSSPAPAHAFHSYNPPPEGWSVYIHGSHTNVSHTVEQLDRGEIE